MTRTERSDYINRTITINTYKVIAIDTEDTPKVFKTDIPELAPKTVKGILEEVCTEGKLTLVKYSVIATREELRRVLITDFYAISEKVDTEEKTE